MFSPRDPCPWFFRLGYCSRAARLSLLWHHLPGLVLSDSDTLSPRVSNRQQSSAYAPSVLGVHMRTAHMDSSLGVHSDALTYAGRIRTVRLESCVTAQYPPGSAWLMGSEWYWCIRRTSASGPCLEWHCGWVFRASRFVRRRRWCSTRIVRGEGEQYPARTVGGADLDELRAQVNNRDQLTDPQWRAGVPVGLLPIVVSVSGLQRPRDHGVHPLSVDLQLHLACPPDGWLATVTRLPRKRRHTCFQGVRELVPS